MRTNHILITLAACAALLSGAACNKNDMNEARRPREITFGVSTGVDVVDGFDARTKATAMTSVTSFKASTTTGTSTETNSSPCWNNITFTSDGAGTPTYKAGKYWPNSNPSFNVYAVTATNGSAAGAASAAPDITFAGSGSTITVSNDINKDVACAYLPYGTGSGKAAYKTKNTLTFEHIFARVSTVKVNASGIYNISNITISLVDPKTGGTYNIKTGAGQTGANGWSSLLPSASSTTTIYTKSDSAIAAGGNHTGSNNDLYIVPGTYYLKATWTATKDDYTQTFTNVSSTSAVTIVKNKINSIEVNLTGNATELTFSVSLSPWSDNSITGVTFPVS